MQFVPAHEADHVAEDPRRLVNMREEVLIDPAIAEKARLPIERMINLKN